MTLLGAGQYFKTLVFLKPEGVFFSSAVAKSVSSDMNGRRRKSL